MLLRKPRKAPWRSIFRYPRESGLFSIHSTLATPLTKGTTRALMDGILVLSEIPMLPRSGHILRPLLALERMNR
jgi:hypothetical protein